MSRPYKTSCNGADCAELNLELLLWSFNGAGMGLADSYCAKLNFHHVGGTRDDVGILLSGPARCFGPRSSRPVLFGPVSASTTTFATMVASTPSSTGSKGSGTFPMFLAPLNQTGKGSQLNEFSDKIPYLSAFFGTMSDALVVATPQCGVCPWLRSSRARKTDKLQVAGFL